MERRSGLCFVTLKKAFDRVWHAGLLHKFRACGVFGSLLDLFNDYLSNRRQRVVLPGAKSEWVYIRAGVPQGSVLDPLLFLIFIIDIVNEIGSNIRLFADDSSLYIIVENTHSSALLLNSDLQKISDWADNWLVLFTPLPPFPPPFPPPLKKESLVISRKLNKPIHPPFFMHHQQIKEVQSQKHLGLYLTNDGSWHDHIQYIKEKAWARVNTMRKLKFKLDRKSLEIIYTTFIRPILEYGNTIWGNCANYEKEELEKIQHEAARIATGTTRLVSLHNLYNEIKWESLQKRRDDHKATLFFKMKNNLVLHYLSSLDPSTVGSASRYSLRNVDNLQNINTKTAQSFWR